MCQAALDAGLAGIAFTEHNVWWESWELRELRMTFPDLTILGGVEVTWLDHHFLVFLPGEEKAELSLGWSVGELTERVHALDGVVIWAHPFRFHDDSPSWLNHAQLDGIEIDSNHMNPSTSAQARRIAEEKGLRTLCNSDAHDASWLGEHYNVLVKPVKSTRELVEYIRGD
jgi:histidinol phosphatase-like PHP family hydrolase